MKSGQIFWGTFFIAIGALVFLVRYDVINISWSFAWELWPFIFIFWGIIVIAKNSKAKPFISALFGLFLAVLMFGVFYNFSSGDIYFSENDNYDVKHYSFNYDDSVKFANLEVNGGVGAFIIKRTSNNLIDSKAKGPISDYIFDTRFNDSTAWIDCYLEDTKVDLFFTKIKNTVELKLNENPIWDLEFNIGAAKSVLDLSNFKVANLSLNSGASSTKIKLGDKHSYTNVDADLGAASLELSLPKSSGCKITGDMVLVIKDLEGFEKTESGYYITGNFDEAENKIAIDVNSGVSSFTVIRY
ncbi:MAG: hypothetical protein HND52_05805 [Ignavibacteriae bacterium]|nr:hypothetical protein [Ignavibacteriota bacterium]NOG97465.1 hypothetical protein [Ignavibacteriota bacterium]